MSDAAVTLIEQSEDAIVQRACDWLVIPSISTDPAYADRVQQAARWCAEHLQGSGLAARVLETDGHPVVYAATEDADVANPTAPRMLFYGHYDVQPAERGEGWTSDPFAPAVRDRTIYARGASDDKGQVMCFLEALRAWRQSTGKLPCHVTVLIEGEEECGSVSLPGFIEKHRERLAADVAVVSDTAMWDGPDGPVPTITYALRGLLYFDVKLHGPSRDLHSGVYGGALANPATMLGRVLGGLFDAKGRVTIPGYYDDVQPLSAAERDAWQELGFDEQGFLGAVGVERAWGEAGYSTLERRWSRPACDVNGLYGGYMGQGAKTVIPSYAGAKVSFRLAADQDPDRIAQAFRQWLGAWDVGGCRWEIAEHGRAWPVAVARDSAWVRRAGQAIERAAGRAPVLVREGATIPVVADFKRQLGLDTLLMGFGLNSDNIHSPDEHFAIDRLMLGTRVHAELMGRLGETGGQDQSNS